MRGYKMPPRTEEHRRHLSESLRGRHLSPEHIAKMSALFKGRIPWNKGKTGIFSEETLRSISNSLKGNKLSDETKRKISEAGKGRVLSEETKLKIGMGNKGKGNSRPESWRKQKSSRMKELFADPEWGVAQRKRLRIAQRPRSEETKAKIGEASRKRWANPEYKARVLKAIYKGQKKRPTELEKVVMRLLNIACPNDYKYTGDGSMVICGRIPDFTNINGQKKVIEVFGDYYHNPNINEKVKDSRTEAGTMKAYKAFGFGCLIIWASELKKESDEILVKRIRKFNNA